MQRGDIFQSVQTGNIAVYEAQKYNEETETSMCEMRFLTGLFRNKTRTYAYDDLNQSFKKIWPGSEQDRLSDED